MFQKLQKELYNFIIQDFDYESLGSFNRTCKFFHNTLNSLSTYQLKRLIAIEFIAGFKEICGVSPDLHGKYTKQVNTINDLLALQSEKGLCTISTFFGPMALINLYIDISDLNIKVVFDYLITKHQELVKSLSGTTAGFCDSIMARTILNVLIKAEKIEVIKNDYTHEINRVREYLQTEEVVELINEYNTHMQWWNDLQKKQPPVTEKKFEFCPII